MVLMFSATYEFSTTLDVVMVVKLIVILFIVGDIDSIKGDDSGYQMPSHGPQKQWIKGVLHPRPILWLFVHFSQKLQHIGDK